VRLTCTDCPKTFRTPTGLEWHREHNHQAQELPTTEEDLNDNSIGDPAAVDKPDDTDKQHGEPTTLTVVWNTNTGTYEVEKPSRLASPAPSAPSIEEPRASGDYNCMDCPGANHVGGFFLRAAISHHRATGHRLKHIPGSFEAALSQLTNQLGQSWDHR